jgi:superfamily II DNA or RNA helicase
MGLSEHFARYVKGYNFAPKYKARLWDGKIRLFHFQDGKIYVGLIHELLDYLKGEGYSVKIDPLVKECFNAEYGDDLDDFLENHVMSAHGSKIDLHDYQIKTVKTFLTQKRKLIKSPTSSGKSAIIYTAVKFLVDRVFDKSERVLIVVPTIGLISQMINDFKDYSSLNGWDVSSLVGAYGAGQKSDKQIIVATWQSIYKHRAEWFDSFRFMVFDEVHQATAQSLTGIGQKCNAEFRMGLSGSIDDEDETSELTLKGLFGSKLTATTTKDLMRRGLIAELDIHGVQLSYKFVDKQYFKKKDYQKEIDWVMKQPGRNEFIVDLADRVEGNVLVLFSLVEKQGKPLFKMAKETATKEVFFVYGGTDVDQREKIRQIAETHKGCIIFASYQTFATGVSIRSINNIIFASTTKSFTRVIQSIGRGLRKSATKTKCTLFDIFDSIYGGTDPEKANYSFRHFIERIKIYTREGHDFDVTKVEIDNEPR